MGAGVAAAAERQAMPRLVLSLDGVVLREVNLTKDRTTIGRRSHNDLVIDNLAVSGEHAAMVKILSGANAGRELALVKALTTIGRPGHQVAVITRRPTGYFIAHVEGDVFPMVNGHNLGSAAHPLNDKDVIELAGVKMEFSNPTAPPAPSAS